MAARQSNLIALIWCSVPVDTQAVGKLVNKEFEFDVVSVPVMCRVWRLLPTCQQGRTAGQRSIPLKLEVICIRLPVIYNDVDNYTEAFELGIG